MVTPHFEYEHGLYKQGIKYVAGVDEVGRGAWAGPIVAASVILPFPITKSLLAIKESNQISEKQRENLYQLIQKQAVSFTIDALPNTYIDTCGLTKANREVVENSLSALEPEPDYALIDLIKTQESLSLKIPYQMILRGDMTILSIAAASIIAKVTRDRLMKEAHKLYPLYGFDKHKGYGTALHEQRLMLHGISPIHRVSYKPIKNILHGSRTNTI